MNQDNLKLIDIYDITYNPWWMSFWFKIFVILLIVIIIILIGLYCYKKYIKKSIPYWQLTLNFLSALKNNNQIDGQSFYLELTNVLKKYLQERYKVHLVDKTDIELLQEIKNNTEMPNFIYDLIQKILDGVMVIKFANQKAIKEQMDLAINLSIEVVNKTLIKK